MEIRETFAGTTTAPESQIEIFVFSPLFVGLMFNLRPHHFILIFSSFFCQPFTWGPIRIILSFLFFNRLQVSFLEYE